MEMMMEMSFKDSQELGVEIGGNYREGVRPHPGAKSLVQNSNILK